MVYLLLILLLLGGLVASYSLKKQFGKTPWGEHLKKLGASANYHLGVFRNNHESPLSMTFKGSIRILSGHIFEGATRRPHTRLPSTKLAPGTEDGAYLTWFGHSTFFYEVSGLKVLFDPMLGKHASPLPFTVTRYPYTLPATADELPPLDVVIISHDHYDHLDYGTIKRIHEKTKTFIVPLGVGSHLVYWGVPQEKITELDWWQGAPVGDVTFTATPSQHFSGRSFSDRKKTLWASWVVATDTSKLFFGGDSGYFEGFKEIGKKHGPFDITLLDSAQYNPLWNTVHMFPEQSVQAHKDLAGKVHMPIHWSAFTLSTHEWTAPVERALIESARVGVTMVTPMIGERFNIQTDRPSRTWWRGLE